MLPGLIFEDEHLLVVNKPPGLNTHAPSPYAGEGLYDWLRHREPRWANLAIIQRLDKETSGVILFSKTQAANRSLTEQFAGRTVRKTYLLLTDRSVPPQDMTVKTVLVRAGDRYVSRPLRAGGEIAETRFHAVALGAPASSPACFKTPELAGGDAGAPRGRLVEARPRTGRTHQIRVHAAEQGFPVLGDTLYGGTPAPRVFLHAAELTLRHPLTSKAMTFRAPAEFSADPRALLRAALINPEATNAYRLVHGASDGWPGWYVDRLGDYLLCQSEQPLAVAQRQELERLMKAVSARGAYHKLLSREVRRAAPNESSPQLVGGEPAPERFRVRENNVAFELSFQEGYSVGLFLDQRDNRHRLLTGHVGAGFALPRLTTNQQPATVLNTFAYTCGFSVAAARGGARTTNLDLSRKYLDWGKRNFELNQLPPLEHDFIYGDVFDWLRRLAKKGRAFSVILLDPPTFSQSKVSGVFRAENDYARLVSAALPVLERGGVLFASTNAAAWRPEEFLAAIERGARVSRRRVLQRHYVPQPPDFPVSRQEPAYLKTVWLRID